MMSDQTDILTTTLMRFGLASDEARIYLHLLEKGPLSALTISREIHMARTRVYRILDKLEAKGIVKQKFDTLGLKFTACPYTQLELLLADRQSELDSLKGTLPTLFHQLEGLAHSQSAGSKVFYHHGIDGLKHVTWNSLRAKGDLLIYEVSATMNAFLSSDFSEKVRQELAGRKIHVRQLTNLTQIEAYTKVTELVRNWRVRHVSPKELTIKSEVLIYNDVTAFYHYIDKDIFCVEIVSSDLTRMQKQIFEFIWRYAREMKKIGNLGEAIVNKR